MEGVLPETLSAKHIFLNLIVFEFQLKQWLTWLFQKLGEVRLILP